MSVASFEEGLIWNDDFQKLPEKLRSSIVEHIRRQDSTIYRLEKRLKEEPFAWVVQCKSSGLIEQAEPHEKATNPNYWTDAFPVYARKSENE